MPVVHLLRRAPWHVWHGATGGMRVPGVMAPGAASSLVGVNVQAKGTWDERDGKRQLIRRQVKIPGKLSCSWNTYETFICIIMIQ